MKITRRRVRAQQRHYTIKTKGWIKRWIQMHHNSYELLIHNIYLVNCATPTRTRTADLLITNQLIDFPKLFFELQIRPRNF
jgi:hypothetical protein